MNEDGLTCITIFTVWLYLAPLAFPPELALWTSAIGSCLIIAGYAWYKGIGRWFQ